jgi:hypothetical protein
MSHSSWATVKIDPPRSVTVSSPSRCAYLMTRCLGGFFFSTALSAEG